MHYRLNIFSIIKPLIYLAIFYVGNSVAGSTYADIGLDSAVIRRDSANSESPSENQNLYTSDLIRNNPLHSAINQRRLPGNEVMRPVDEEHYPDLKTKKPSQVLINSEIDTQRLISECSSAQRALIQFETEQINNVDRRPRVTAEEINNPYMFSKVWYDGSTLLRKDLNNYKELVDKYNVNCFDKAQNFSDLAKLSALVGILSMDLGQESIVWCTAFRITENKIVTAKHCKKNLPSTIERSKISFTLTMMSPHEKVKVLKEACDSDKSSGCQIYIKDQKSKDVISDYLILEIEPMKTKLPQLSWSKPSLEESKSIVLASWNAYPTIYKKSAQALTGQEIDSHDENQIYISKKGYCQVSQVSQSCILHGCQSTPGSSGAPIISWQQNNEIKVIGIHVAVASSTKDHPGCDAKVVHIDGRNHVGNVAIPLPDYVVSTANYKK